MTKKGCLMGYYVEKKEKRRVVFTTVKIEGY